MYIDTIQLPEVLIFYCIFSLKGYTRTDERTQCFICMLCLTHATPTWHCYDYLALPLIAENFRLSSGSDLLVLGLVTMTPVTPVSAFPRQHLAPTLFSSPVNTGQASEKIHFNILGKPPAPGTEKLCKGWERLRCEAGKVADCDCWEVD